MADVAKGGASEPQLKRTVGTGQLMFYALGSMLGSGIYALIGKAASNVGNAVWLSFLVALAAALLTALSYASLGSRYPRAGGAAYVTQRAYGIPVLSFLVGLALVCSGLSSVATQSKVFADNIHKLMGGALPVEGGVAIAFRREIAAAAEPAAKRAELEAQFAARQSPFRRAEAFGVHDLIHPHETRTRLSEWLDLVQPKVRSQLGPAPFAYRP